MNRRLIIALSIIVLSATVGHGDEAVIIKRRLPEQGDTVKQTRVETESNTAVLTDGAGAKIAEQRSHKETRSAYTDVYETQETSKKLKKVKRTYESASMKEDDKDIDIALSGKTVVIEQSGGKHSFKYANGGAVTGNAAVLLRMEFKDRGNDDAAGIEDAVLPKTAVKPGENWKVDVTKVIDRFAKEGMKIDASRSTGTAKLVRVYEKDGARFGVMDIGLELAVTDFGKKKANVKLAEDATVKLQLKLDICVDGSKCDGASQVAFDMRAHMKVMNGDAESDVQVVSKRTLVETTEKVK